MLILLIITSGRVLCDISSIHNGKQTQRSEIGSQTVGGLRVKLPEEIGGRDSSFWKFCDFLIKIAHFEASLEYLPNPLSIFLG